MSHEPRAAADPDLDERLFEEVHDLLRRTDPVPARVLTAARETLTWRAIDAELAELVYDSLLDSRESVGVRGDASPRLLTFEGEDVTIDVEVAVIGDRRRLLGQVVPGQPAGIEIRHGEGRHTVHADDLGRFRVEDVASGPVSLRCRLLDESAPALIDTDWVAL